MSSDFLGQATLPTVMLLHPPAGGVEAPITIPLLPSKGPAEPHNVYGSSGRGAIAATADVEAAEGDGRAAGSEGTAIAGPRKPAAVADTGRHLLGGSRGTERFATRLMHNVQKHLRMDDTITGTLTVSLELFQYGDDKEGSASGGGGGVREPGPPPGSAEYAAARFRVAEDATEARRRREREGIQVPRMLSRVKELHDKLKGGRPCM